MSNVLEALAFPFRRSSLKMFIGLCVLFLIQFTISFLPIIGLFTLLFVGYIYATQLKIIFTTGNGYSDAPDFPEFTDLFDNVVVPILKILLVSCIAWLPLILVSWQMDSLGNGIVLASTVFAYGYMPIGLMIVALDETSKAINPILIVQTILKTGWSYVILVLSYACFDIGSELLLQAFSGSWILNCLFGPFGILFTGRLIGSVYRDRLAQDIFEDIETPEPIAPLAE